MRKYPRADIDAVAWFEAVRLLADLIAGDDTRDGVSDVVNEAYLRLIDVDPRRFGC